MSRPPFTHLTLTILFILVSLAYGYNLHGTRSSERVIEVGAYDYYFSPDTIELTLGETVKVRVANYGYTTHTFTAPGFNVDITVAPGESKEVTLKADKEGVFEFYCKPHKDLGMKGKIIVKA